MSKDFSMWRPPSNAFKHGAFSNAVVLPTENPGEFEKLKADLIDELQPSGPLEYDAVLTIVKLTWRKQRLNIFRKAEVLRESLTPYLKKPPLEQLQESLRIHKERLSHALQQIEADQFFPRHTEGESEDLKGCEHEAVLKVSKMTEDTRKEQINFILEASAFRELAEIADFVTPERYVKDLEIEARIDAQIDRQLKRLFFLKGMKEVAAYARLVKHTEGGSRSLRKGK